MKLGMHSAAAVLFAVGLLSGPPLSAGDSLVVYSGEISAGVDAKGDLFFALDESTAGGVVDGILDRLFVVQGRTTLAPRFAEQPSFQGEVYLWDDELVVKDAQGEILARFYVAMGDDSERVDRWRARSMKDAQRAVGIIQNIPKAQGPIDLAQYLRDALEVDAQAALRHDLLADHLIQHPDPGGSGGSGSCSSGGPGSSSCSTSFGGDGCSVSCTSGYYACCIRGGVLTASSCYCVHN